MELIAIEINGQTAIITGGSSGLGEATVRMFINNGANVAIIDLDEERGNKLADELGSQAIFIKTDVADEKMVNDALEKTVSFFGGINIAVNCAGVVLPKKVLGKRGVHDLESFKKVLNINVVGTFNILRLAAEQMSKNAPNNDDERGVIINTASISAFDGQIGQAAYSASKGAVASMTLPIARELATVGIRVMSVAPGIFETPMFNSLSDKNRKELAASVPFPNRLGRPEEYAHLIKSVVENSMLNGEVIRIDGSVRLEP